MTLTLYTNPMSRGRVARWMLEETGEPYERVILTYGGSMKAPDYLRLNPMGKVPTVVHDGHVVTESAAICAYCAEAFPAADLAPKTVSEQADYFRWLFFAAGVVEPAITARAMKLEASPQQATSVGYGTVDTALSTLEAMLAEREYVVGDRFTAADVYVGSMVGWGIGFNMIDKRPAFEAYVARVSARPAHRRASDLDDKDGEAITPA